MKLTIILFMLLNFKAISQTNCPIDIDKKKYLETIVELTRGCVGIQLVINARKEDEKLQKFVMSNIELSRFLGMDFCNDSTFAVKMGKILTDTVKVSELKFNSEDYNVSERIYSELAKSTPCEVYKKYFNEKNGTLRDEKYFYFEELASVIAYLIDNYSVIIVNHLTDFCVMIKPRCSGCKR